MKKNNIPILSMQMITYKEIDCSHWWRVSLFLKDSQVRVTIQNYIYTFPSSTQYALWKQKPKTTPISSGIQSQNTNFYTHTQTHTESVHFKQNTKLSQYLLLCFCRYPAFTTLIYKQIKAYLINFFFKHLFLVQGHMMPCWK